MREEDGPKNEKPVPEISHDWTTDERKLIAHTIISCLQDDLDRSRQASDFRYFRRDKDKLRWGIVAMMLQNKDIPELENRREEILNVFRDCWKGGSDPSPET